MGAAAEREAHYLVVCPNVRCAGRYLYVIPDTLENINLTAYLC